MRAPIILVAIPGCMFVLVAGLSGLGLSGPEQRFAIPPGGSETSYLRVWNDGPSYLQVSLMIAGNASGFVQLSTKSIALQPGTSSRVELLYSVPTAAAGGRYSGEIIVQAGDQLQAVPARDILVIVGVSSSSIRMELDRGLNLLCWPGEETTFQEAFQDHPEIFKVWAREQSGEYSVSTRYQDRGLWWSPDAGFELLRTGHAYFLECSSPVEILVEKAAPIQRELELRKGINLVGWTGPTTPVADAFSQSPNHSPIRKIWRKNQDGSYSSMEYFASVDTWWSPDSGFACLDQGRAYFIEAVQDCVWTVVG